MTKRLENRYIFWIMVCILAASITHWPHVPILITILQCTAVLLRIYLLYANIPLHSHQAKMRPILLATAIIGMVIVYVTYGQLTGRNPGIALLVLLTGLKLFELETRREVYISIYIIYFLILANLLYSQSIPMTLYMLSISFFSTVIIIAVNDTHNTWSKKTYIKSIAIMFAQALPMMIALFVLFPRISGPLWGLPHDAHQARTGISGSMSPGSISHLVESDEIAFRVDFKGAIPPSEKLYWRGPVLWFTDGRTWFQGRQIKGVAQAEFIDGAIDYTITYEPNNKYWLFALDLVKTAPHNSYLTFDHQLKSHRPIYHRQALQLTSYLDFRLKSASSKEKWHALLLPRSSHPQAHLLAQDLLRINQDQKAYVAAVLNWFKQNNFQYTLTPALITGDMVDTFLFDQRQGFCEHYAAAFTVLMRAANIPARVVTGYLGGEINPLGNYLIVRQKHAHAWTEVWLEDEGWTRIDPTAIVSPARVNGGIEELVDGISADFFVSSDSIFGRFWQHFSYRLDMINYQWAKWMLAYGPEQQRALLGKLGLKTVDWRALGVLLAVFLIVFIIAGCIYFMRLPQAKHESASSYYMMFCKKMSKLGIGRYLHEGPRDYANRIIKTKHELQSGVEDVTQNYIAARYHSRPQHLVYLKQAVKKFIDSC